MFENRTKLTIGAIVLMTIFILIEHYNGGVASHHLLAREDLPKISNWWGLLTVPILTWVVCFLTNRRFNKNSYPNQTQENENNKILKRFLSALTFGILVSVLWEYHIENVLQYFILLPFLIAIFRPVHFPECLLGFVIGMIYSFGGILPIIIGFVIILVSFILNKLFHIIKTVFRPN